jgi:hypothetical protein
MNTYELKRHPSGCYQSSILCNGVSSWELHPPHLKTDLKVLETFRDKKFYQHYKGPWTITLPDDHKIFKDDKLEIAIRMAITYINERDYPHWEDHF